jgi:hypothetical protein
VIRSTSLRLQHQRIICARASSLAADTSMDDSGLMPTKAEGAEDASYSLTDEMKDCRSMLDIAEVVQEEAADMSPAEVSLALYRIAYLSRSAGKEGPCRLEICTAEYVRCPYGSSSHQRAMK